MASIFSCLPVYSANLYVASSLAEPIQRIKTELLSDLQIVIGSSSTLARQISAGAPADIFLSANYEWAEFVASQNSSLKVVPFASNQLVLSQRGNNLSTNQPNLKSILLGDAGLVVVGDPSHVPLGQYTAQVASSLNISRPNWIPARSARHAVRLLEIGEVEWGVLYKTDVQASSNLFALQTIPTSYHQPIVYWLVALTPEGDVVAQRLKAQDSQSIFKQLGFLGNDSE